MAALSEDQKLLVVMRLAAFISPAEIIKELKLNFELDVKPQQLTVYDPDHAAGKRLSKELTLLFRQTRARFLTDISDIPIAHQAGRLRLLDDIARQARAKGNLLMAMQAAEQAAKDLGGMYLNKLDPKLLSDDQLCRILGLAPGGPQPGPAEAGSGPAGVDGGGSD